MDSKDPVAIISQIITSRVHYSHHNLLLDYSLKNKRLYYCGKLYLPNKDSLHLYILQESYNQLMAGYPGVAKTYKILQCSNYWPKMVETLCQYIRNCYVCARVKLASDQ